MIGPILLLAAGVVAGFAVSGLGGAVGGALIALTMLMAIVVAASSWVSSIGRHLDPADARRLAPCPPGFSRLCELAYRRLDRPQNPEMP